MRTKLRSLLVVVSLFAAPCFARSAPVRGRVSEREAVAATLVLEAGNSGIAGMEAVMWVVRNRAETRGFSAYAIVTARGQFAVMRSGAAAAVAKARTHPLLPFARRIYDDWKSGRRFDNATHIDPTSGATYFESAKNTPPPWVRSVNLTAVFGDNRFYADPKRIPASFLIAGLKIPAPLGHPVSLIP